MVSTLPRTQHREGRVNKVSSLAKMAQETDMTLKAILQQREESSRHMVLVAGREDEASNYTRPKKRGKSLVRRVRSDKGSRQSESELRSRSPDRR